MKASMWLVYGFALSAVSMALTACGGGDGGGSGGSTGSTSSTSSTATGDMTSSTSTGTSAGDLPQGAAAVEAWIAKGDYKSWHCEAEKHAARSPSPHDYNRICSNDILSTNAAGAAYPKGAASVKELWGKDGKAIVGYAYYLKLQADSAAGKGWYYYEKNPEIMMGGPVADGVGDSGTPNTVCVACHKAAGSDAMHSGHDFVYTQVK
jgi:hypothetical protein